MGPRELRLELLKLTVPANRSSGGIQAAIGDASALEAYVCGSEEVSGEGRALLAADPPIPPSPIKVNDNRGKKPGRSMFRS